MKLRTLLILLVVALMVTIGCSAGSSIGAPSIQDSNSNIDRTPGGDNHFCFGYWQMVADPVAKNLDIIEMREAAIHVNVLPLLEPPVFLNLTLEYLEFIGSTEIIADVGLRHPFIGLTEFTGFDVCGILITKGSQTFGGTGLAYAGDNDTHLMNPDGFTRWWNPDEFPVDGTIFNYKDGLLGTPDSIANFNSKLNGYKYYTNELDQNSDDILTVTTAARGMFSAGQKNVRRFHIKLGTDGLVFNYAVDASWEPPNGTSPWTAPDDFPENANKPEAWGIRVTEINNTLFNNGSSSGGGLSLQVDVYDHFNGEQNTVKVQSPGNFIEAIGTQSGEGDGYSTYEVEITNATPSVGSIPLYYVIESEVSGYANKIPGAAVSAYFIGSAGVSGSADQIQVITPNGGENWQAATQQEITWDCTGNVGPVNIEYSKDGFISDINTITTSTPNDGSFMWTIPPDPSDTVRIRISDAAIPAVNDQSDADFSITLPGCVIHVDDNNTSGPWDGTAAYPFKLLQDAVDAVSAAGCMIWVHPGIYIEDDGGSMYTGLGEVTVQSKTDLTIYGEGLPTLHMPIYLANGKAAIHAFNSPGFTVEGIGFSHNYAYQSTVWLETCAGSTIKDCQIVPTLGSQPYGFLEFLRASSSPNLTVEGNILDDFNSASTFMNLFVLSNCDDSVITLNECRNMNPNSGYNMSQTGESYFYAYNCNNLEVSKNIFGAHHRSSPSSNYVQLNVIYIYGGSGAVVRNNLIFDCLYDDSIGASNNTVVYATYVTGLEVYNNTIDRFGPTTPTGSGTTYGLFVDNCSGQDIYNNILSNITNPDESYGVWGNTAFSQSYSDVWTVTGAIASRYSGSASEAGTGINADPMYVDPLNEDYTLEASSPCQATGLNGDDMGCHGGPDPLP